MSAWFPGRRRDEVRSTIVPRVPNKSVEDLYCLDQPQAVGDPEECESPVRTRSSSSTTRVAAGSKASTVDQEEAYQAVGSIMNTSSFCLDYSE